MLQPGGMQQIISFFSSASPFSPPTARHPLPTLAHISPDRPDFPAKRIFRAIHGNELYAIDYPNDRYSASIKSAMPLWRRVKVSYWKRFLLIILGASSNSVLRRLSIIIYRVYDVTFEATCSLKRCRVSNHYMRYKEKFLNVIRKMTRWFTRKLASAIKSHLEISTENLCLVAYVIIPFRDKTI